jgi:hypothetical protein
MLHIFSTNLVKVHASHNVIYSGMDGVYGNKGTYGIQIITWSSLASRWSNFGGLWLGQVLSRDDPILA